MYHSLLNFKTFLTQLTSIMNMNYLFVQTGCISSAAKPFTLSTHKLFFLTLQSESQLRHLLSCQKLDGIPQSRQVNA